ncbi:DUF188 domain-containing protein [Cytobacillus eiseniae]|nr:DUF188 domain-containing protein [Cytobacillus eiseniae]
MNPKGILFDESEIHTTLDMRYLSAKAHRRGMYGKRSKPFNQEDQSRFIY